MEGLAPELLLQILGFAGPRAAAVYGGCSRAARRLVTDYDFEIFNPPTVDRRFISAPVPVTAADNAAAAEAFKACMELESWRDVWEATAHIVRLPCLGYFSPRETTPFDNEEDARGACLHVVLDREEGALCVRCFMGDVWRDVCYPRVVKEGGALRLDHVSVGMIPPTTHTQYLFPKPEAVGSGGDDPVFRLSPMVPHIGCGLIHAYYPLSAPSLPAASLPADPVLQRLQGLWMGCYGPHGLEALHVRFVGLEGEADGEGAAAGRVVVCEGLKLVGDPNVPSGNWSFRIDLHRPRDLPAAVAADPRPIYTMMGGIGHVLLDLEEDTRAGRLHGIYPGHGQINRVPLTWHPESVGVDLVVWKEEAQERQTEHGGWAFGLVWHDDDDHPVRHCITFQRLDNMLVEALIFGNHE